MDLEILYLRFSCLYNIIFIASFNLTNLAVFKLPMAVCIRMALIMLVFFLAHHNCGILWHYSLFLFTASSIRMNDGRYINRSYMAGLRNNFAHIITNNNYKYYRYYVQGSFFVCVTEYKIVQFEKQSVKY